MPRMRLAADSVAMNQNCGHVCAHGAGSRPERLFANRQITGGRGVRPT